MAFTTPSYSLSDLFARIDRGELQLPDFQRSFSWEVDRIRSLIVTVLRGYPVGALLALDTRNEPMRFRPRPLEGAPATDRLPGLLLLDGQQRLTSLYHCFQGNGLVNTVDFRNKRITRRFFVDVRKAVESDVMPEEAVFSVDENGEATSHFAPQQPGPLLTTQAAIDSGCVPVDALLGQRGSDALFDMAAKADDETREAIKRFHHDVIAPLAGYDIPMIRLGRETARAGIGSIFAQANAAGLQMDVFELLTAVYGTEDPSFSLADEISSIRRRLSEYAVLDAVDRTAFLTALSLYVTALRGEPGGQREDVLTISLAEWRQHAPTIERGFIAAAHFLTDRRIFTGQQVPYSAQVIPLAAILALASFGVDQEAEDRLNRWFWSGVLGELYGSAAVAIRAERDVAQVTQWLNDENAPLPKTVADASFTESRLLSVDSDTGVWRGMFALLMARGAKDWRTGKEFTPETYAELEPSFEPIFPVQWCAQHGIEPVLALSVLNRTPMGKRTEVVLNNFNPTRYLPRIQSKSIMEDDEFDAVLATHELDPAMLHASNAQAFFGERRARLLALVEEAMGRPVIRDVDVADIHGGDEGPNAFAE
ncbi:DUF262 domain-containing protein [Corynebacterium tapiri]|uniref:DUF262 domain-containing protein n=1 Tax=Corynebacterium tapiri TaxID=1448266 RepID=A0A5C4U733_9CORY|nr:DUF262 domain-containing protein [Corynebacterium tapiri]TNL99797.1 DUF262 domain-containing protein [Corynebacterium tapiri]